MAGSMIAGLGLVASAFGVGVLIGGVGVGGVLLVPALVYFAALPVHQAVAASMFCFVFAGVAAVSRLHARDTSFHFGLPVLLGTIPGAALGTASLWLLPNGLIFVGAAGLAIFTGQAGLDLIRRQRVG